MSIISKIYFSSKNTENLSELEEDKEALTVWALDLFMLMDPDLNYLPCGNFSKYIERKISEYEKDGQEFMKLSDKFISDCAKLTQDDLRKINKKMNEYIRLSWKERKFKIDYITGGIKVLASLLIGLSLIYYFQLDNIPLSILSIIIAFSIFFVSYGRQKGDWEKLNKFKETDYLPQLNKLVEACREAKNRNLHAYYYWSL